MDHEDRRPPRSPRTPSARRSTRPRSEARADGRARVPLAGAVVHRVHARQDPARVGQGADDAVGALGEGPSPVVLVPRGLGVVGGHRERVRVDGEREERPGAVFRGRDGALRDGLRPVGASSSSSRRAAAEPLPRTRGRGTGRAPAVDDVRDVLALLHVDDVDDLVVVRHRRVWAAPRPIGPAAAGAAPPRRTRPRSWRRPRRSRGGRSRARGPRRARRGTWRAARRRSATATTRGSRSQPNFGQSIASAAPLPPSRRDARGGRRRRRARACPAGGAQRAPLARARARVGASREMTKIASPPAPDLARAADGVARDASSSGLSVVARRRLPHGSTPSSTPTPLRPSTRNSRKKVVYVRSARGAVSRRGARVA